MGKLYCHTSLYIGGKPIVVKGETYPIIGEDDYGITIQNEHGALHYFTKDEDEDGDNYATWLVEEEEAWIVKPLEEEGATATEVNVEDTFDLQSEIEHEIRAVLQEMQSARRRGAVSEYRTYASTLVKLSTLINL